MLKCFLAVLPHTTFDVPTDVVTLAKMAGLTEREARLGCQYGLIHGWLTSPDLQAGREYVRDKTSPWY